MCGSSTWLQREVAYIGNPKCWSTPVINWLDTIHHWLVWCYWAMVLELQYWEEHTAGLVEQIVLWNVPFGLVVLITLVLFITSLCLLGCVIKNSEAHNVIEKVITDSIFSLVFLTVMSVLYILEVTTRTYSFSNQQLGVWVVYAISTPLGHFFIPIAPLMAIYLPLSSVIAKYTHRKQQSQISRGHGLVTLENRTLHHSSVRSEPSHSTWEPLHSSNEDSEDALLVHDKPKRNYRSTDWSIYTLQSLHITPQRYHYAIAWTTFRMCYCMTIMPFVHSPKDAASTQSFSDRHTW